MNLFRPNMYKKNIFEIDYNKLKEQGITCLVFDLDNTLGLISSNNTKKRIAPDLKDLGIGGVAFSLKPSTKGLRKIKKHYNLKKKEMVMIGDQIVTDILSGNRYKIMTILVDPLGEKDLRITGLNRKIEARIIKYYKKRGMFERGKYYG